MTKDPNAQALGRRRWLNHPVRTVICDYCGEEFKAKHPKARYCPRPRRCREYALEQRKKQEE